MTKYILTALAAALCASPANADEATIEELLRRIEALEAQIEILRAQAADAAPRRPGRRRAAPPARSVIRLIRPACAGAPGRLAARSVPAAPSIRRCR
jgi:hypothetical protein